MIRGLIRGDDTKATSSRQRRSIPRDERSPIAYAYTNRATIIAGSCAARPQPSSR